MGTTIISVQYLRGIAALMVVYFHTKVYLAGYAWGVPRNFGYSGVDLFFCISGFIMMHTTLGRPVQPASFLRNRLLRVYPLYWLLTLSSLALYVIAPSAFIDGSASLGHAILSLLLIAHFDAPVLRIGWTLVYEIFFYALFALTLWATPHRRLPWLCALIIGLVALGAFCAPESPVLQTYTHPFLLEFLAGAAIGAAFRSERFTRLPSGLAILCLLAGIGLIVLGMERRGGDGFSRVLWFGSGAALILLAGLVFERRGRLFASRWLHDMGEASYSLYLTHPFVLTGFRQIGRRLGVADGTALVQGLWVMAAISTAIVTGWLTYRLVEQPLQRALRERGWNGRKTVDHLPANAAAQT